MTKHLFGTDGMRGVALEAPLDEATVARLGAALFDHLRAAGAPPRILMAGDTRASTDTLAEWVGGAFTAAGGDVLWAGVLPTPAVSHLMRDRGGFGAGLVVSASHNPAADNGIKLVTGAGSKWPTADERALELRLRALDQEPPLAVLPVVDETLRARYLDLLAATLSRDALAGETLVVDAAHGAAFAVAAELFTRLGATVDVINAAPDGGNINLHCGALHPEGLAAEVVRRGAAAGVAFDGDADRAVLVAGSGRILDGDDVLYIWGRALASDGVLPGRAVVATVMSNLGLEVGLGRHDIGVHRCAVGDREVWQEMEHTGAALGGEQSGHVICRHHAVTGDGLLTAAHVLAIARRTGRTLDELADLEHFPQVLANVRVARRVAIDQVPELAAAIRDHQARLDGQGRVFVRYSGTEPLLRVMVEAPTAERARAVADDIAAHAHHALG